MIDALNTNGICGLKPGGVKSTYVYTAKNDIDLETDPLGRQTDYVYDSAGNLTRVFRKDAANNIVSLTCTEYHPDGSGRPIAVVNSTDLSVPASPTAPCSGHKTKYEYTDQWGNLTATINPRFSAAGSPKTTFSYDAGGRLLSTTDELGHTTSNEYDPQNNVKMSFNALRQIIGTAESGVEGCGIAGTGDGQHDDDDGIVDDGCPSVINLYDAKGLLDKSTDANGKTTDYNYDDSDRLKDVIDAATQTTSYSYDANGNSTMTTPNRQPLGAPEPSNACLTDTDSDGYCNHSDADDDNDGVNDVDETNCGSDPLNSLRYPERTDVVSGDPPLHVDEDGDTLINEPLPLGSGNHDCEGDGYGGNAEAGTPLCNGVNNDGFEDTVVDDGCLGGPIQSGTYSEAEFNIFDIPPNVGTPQQNRCGTTNWPADLASAGPSFNKVTLTDVSSFIAPLPKKLNTKPSDAGFNARWDLVPGGTTESGNWIILTDMSSVSAGTAPMFSGRKMMDGPSCPNVGIATGQAPGPFSECGASGTGDGVDADGDTIKDDGCPSMKYAYDALNRLTSETDALGRVTSYQYDVASNLKQRTDARGIITNYKVDDANRLTCVWTGAATPECPSGSVQYTYDHVGNRKTMVDPIGTTTYDYDALDRPTSVTFPGPSTVGYTYDDLPGGSAADYPGQRTKVTYPDTKTVTYTYEPDGRMKTVTDWLARQTVYTYDAAGRLANATNQHPNVWSDYGYDLADRLTSVVNKKTGPVTISSFTYTPDAVGNRSQMVDSSGTHTYQYDNVYRLTQADYPGADLDTYTYDANGNRKTKNSTAYVYDAADQMASAGGVAHFYDNNGNLTSTTGKSFVYDYENRLTQSTISGVTSTSTYNGDGLRMSHTTGGVTTNYTWDVAAGLPVVLQDGTNTYVYGLDLISTTDGGGVQTYFLYDGLGSTANTVDSAGATTFTYSYDVFGAIRAQDPPGGSNQWLFTGEQRDADSSLYYMRARYYDPGIGRFLGRDPLPTGNLYAYAGNNPVNFVDPVGLNPCLAAVPVAASVAASGVATAGTTTAGSGIVLGIVCVGTVAVVVCLAFCDGAGDVAGDVAGGISSGVSDVAGAAGGLLFGEKNDPKDPGLKNLDTSLQTGANHRPWLCSSVLRDFRHAKKFRQVCTGAFGTLAIIAASCLTLEFAAPVILGEKPRRCR